ncbi:unnamed protein product [Ambrosiozyma monospora]|uniref:Unnamed protein product n=1 Tax=Ambrosiozyma monospora TaxID=43982 RepID=A0ACB5SYY0_AMBMO|nr:unnamed protein product [Ambrosiozyma monospora]
MKAEIQQKLQAFDKETFIEKKSLVQQFSNLPSLDFETRLTTIKMFYPNMIISKINQTIDESSHTESMNVINTLKFTVQFKPFMKFNVTVGIDSTKAVDKLKIEPVGLCVVVEATEIVRLIELTEKSKDISFFLYSINVLYKLQQKRINTCYDIYESFIKKVYSVNGIEGEESEDENKESQDDNNDGDDKKEKSKKYLKFIKFANTARLEIVFNNRKKLLVDWKLILKEKDGSHHFEHDINCFLFDEKQKLVDNLTGLLIKLTKASGIYRALANLIDNLIKT